MGDNAVDIAKTTLRIGGEPLIKPLIDIPRMAEITQNMVKEQTRFIFRKMLLAETLPKDDLVDSLHSQIAGNH